MIHPRPCYERAWLIKIGDKVLIPRADRWREVVFKSRTTDNTVTLHFDSRNSYEAADSERILVGFETDD